jgi:uncharacterized DUF497 family protein
MIFDFDPAKDEANRRKHGVPLLFGVRIFEDPAVAIIPTIRLGDEEERHKAIGLVEASSTRPSMSASSTVRLISVRRSNDGEQRDYDRDPG